MKKIFLIILSCFFILSFVGCSDSSTSSTSSHRITVGQRLTLTHDITACSSKENYSKMCDYVTHNNNSGQKEMYEREEAKNFLKGTQINVVDISGSTYVIEDTGGTKWYTPSEQLEIQ